MVESILLTIQDLAKRLSCSVGHARGLITSGKLKGINMSASEKRYTWRVTEEALAAYLTGATKEVPPTRFRDPATAAC
jgi:hypothetical protein